MPRPWVAPAVHPKKARPVATRLPLMLKLSLVLSRLAPSQTAWILNSHCVPMMSREDLPTILVILCPISYLEVLVPAPSRLFRLSFQMGYLLQEAPLNLIHL